jgi:hypothetical protein
MKNFVYGVMAAMTVTVVSLLAYLLINMALTATFEHKRQAAEQTRQVLTSLPEPWQHVVSAVSKIEQHPGEIDRKYEWLQNLTTPGSSMPSLTVAQAEFISTYVPENPGVAYCYLTRFIKY